MIKFKRVKNLRLCRISSTRAEAKWQEDLHMRKNKSCEVHSLFARRKMLKLKM